MPAKVPTDCKNFESNLQVCNCSYPGCSRKGRCCECLHYHRRMNELPACFFPPHIERTYDRSFECFLKTYQG
ncbi:DUF6485 family protein [Candidatus Hakubella thermalkaliphila]|uniref:DUF6485 family protein n=1 Tax=Candidatus Hakubella thermalkaliphila TaxID=2754717 RepID=UPI001C613C8C